MSNQRELTRRGTVRILLLAAAALAWSAHSGLVEWVVWNWQTGDCDGSPGAILQDQWVDAAPGSKLCVVPPSYLCTRASGASVRWYVDVEIDGQMFLGTTEPDTEHCVITATSPVIVHTSTYCTTFPTRHNGKITFEPEVGKAAVAARVEHLDRLHR
jgi:hypothetical protein